MLTITITIIYLIFVLYAYRKLIRPKTLLNLHLYNLATGIFIPPLLAILNLHLYSLATGIFFPPLLAIWFFLSTNFFLMIDLFLINEGFGSLIGIFGICFFAQVVTFILSPIILYYSNKAAFPKYSKIVEETVFFPLLLLLMAIAVITLSIIMVTYLPQYSQSRL